MLMLHKIITVYIYIHEESIFDIALMITKYLHAAIIGAA